MDFLEIVSGTGINFFSSGIQAAFNRVSSEIKRLAAVEQALLADSDSTHKVAKQAALDMSKALGRHGTYNTTLDQFFMSLFNSGLMVRLCEAAIIFRPIQVEKNRREYKQHSGLFPAFKALFIAHYPGGTVQFGDKDLDANRLFHVLRDALGQSLWHQATPQSAKFIHDTHHKYLRAAFQAVDDRLAEVFAKQKRGAAPSVEQLVLHRSTSSTIRAELVRISAELCRKLEDTNIYGPDDRQKSGVRLDDIFVPGFFTPWNPHDAERQISFWAGTAHIALADLLKTAFRTVIVGDPGGGKTTAAQMMALELARKCQRVDGYLPIVVAVRRYEAALSSDTNLNLLDFVTKTISSDIAYSDHDKLRDVIISCLALGKAFIFFDGLDEIINIGHRKIFADKVTLFAKQYPLCPVVITSRRIGYERAPLPEYFQHYTLSEMTFEQSTAYFTKLSQVVFGVASDRASQDAADFMDKTGRDSPDIVGNPLMMALMVWLYHSRGGEMPHTRARLYQECANLMFERWDRQRNITATLPEGFDLFPLLNELASEIYNDVSLAAGVSRSWLTDRVRRHFLRYYDSDRDIRARRDAAQVIDFITGRAWILTDTGADNYSFTHRTFLEYFFSQALNDESETVGALFQLIRRNIEKGVWTVPAHLALQSKIQARSRSAIDVADQLLEMSQDLSTQDYKTPVTQFLSGAFDYLSTIPESSLSELTRRFAKASLDEADWFRLMINLLRTSNRRRTIIYKALARVIAEEFSKGSRHIHRIADLCKRLHVVNSCSTAALLGHRLFHATEFLEEVKIGLRGASAPPNLTITLTAKLLYDLTGTLPSGESIFGYDAWEQSVSYFKRGDWFIADMEVMLIHLAEQGALGNRMTSYTVALARSLARTPGSLPPGTIPVYEVGLVDADFPFDRACSSPNHDIAFAGVVIAVAYLQYCQTYSMAPCPSGTVFSNLESGYFSVAGRPCEDARTVSDLLHAKNYLFMRRTIPGGPVKTVKPEHFFEG